MGGASRDGSLPHRGARLPGHGARPRRGDAPPRHRTARQGRGFLTIERPRDLEDVPTPTGATILLECLGNWAANELFDDRGSWADSERIAEKIFRTTLNLRRRTANLLIVSNDLFSDGAHYDAGTEAYLRLLGRLHILLADAADAAVECAFGLPRLAKGRMPPSQWPGELDNCFM